MQPSAAAPAPARVPPGDSAGPSGTPTSVGVPDGGTAGATARDSSSRPVAPASCAGRIPSIERIIAAAARRFMPGTLDILAGLYHHSGASRSLVFGIESRPAWL